MFAKLLLGAGFCALAAQGQIMVIGEAILESAEEIADAAIEQRDKAQMGHKLDAIEKELEQVDQELTQINAKLGSIQDEVTELQADLTRVIQKSVLQWPLSVIHSTAQSFMNDQEPELRQKLADDIVLPSGNLAIARDMWLSALDGTCTTCDGGKTIIATQFESTGSVPLHFAQQMFRTMATAQYLMTWALERRGDLGTRHSDLANMTQLYNAAWDKNMKQAFFITSGCQWDKAVTLTCTGASRPATKTLMYQNGTAVLTASHDQSLPTRGGDKDFSLLQCSADGSKWPVGMHGDTHIPHGHSIAYVAGFYLKCDDGSNGVWTDYHQSKDTSVVFDFNLGKPMRKMAGCVNHMKGHDHTFWASGVKIYSVTAPEDPQSCDQPWCSQISHGPDGCSSGDNPIHYTMDCGRGYAMQGFSGQLYTPKGHDIPYIAAMTIRCDTYFDSASTVFEGSTILV